MNPTPKRRLRLSAAQRRALLASSIENERARLARAILGVNRCVARLHEAKVEGVGTAAALAVVAGCTLHEAERAVVLHEDYECVIDDLRTELLGIGLTTIDWRQPSQAVQRPARPSKVASQRISA